MGRLFLGQNASVIYPKTWMPSNDLGQQAAPVEVQPNTAALIGLGLFQVLKELNPAVAVFVTAATLFGDAKKKAAPLKLGTGASDIADMQKVERELKRIREDQELQRRPDESLIAWVRRLYLYQFEIEILRHLAADELFIHVSSGALAPRMAGDGSKRGGKTRGDKIAEEIEELEGSVDYFEGMVDAHLARIEGTATNPDTDEDPTPVLDALESACRYVESFVSEGFPERVNRLGEELEKHSGGRGLPTGRAWALGRQLKEVVRRTSQSGRRLERTLIDYGEFFPSGLLRARYLELRAGYFSIFLEPIEAYKHLGTDLAEAAALRYKAREYPLAFKLADDAANAFRYALRLTREGSNEASEEVTALQRRACEAYQLASRCAEQTGDLEKAALSSVYAAQLQEELTQTVESQGDGRQAADLYMQAAETHARELRLVLENQRTGTPELFASAQTESEMLRVADAAIRVLSDGNAPDELLEMAERIHALPEQIWGGAEGETALVANLEQRDARRPTGHRSIDFWTLTGVSPDFSPSRFTSSLAELLRKIAQKINEQGNAANSAQVARMAVDQLRMSARISGYLER